MNDCEGALVVRRDQGRVSINLLLALNLTPRVAQWKGVRLLIERSWVQPPAWVIVYCAL